MRMTSLMVVLLMMLGLGAQRPRAQSSGQAGKLFASAQHKEVTEGDLKGAIELYRKIAQGADRAMAAQALVRMAECYQKLGDAESKTIYERILRDFADQLEPVALARTRLGVARTASTRGDHPLSLGSAAVDGYSSAISYDGRLLAYTDWVGNRDVILRDLTTGADRVLAQRTPQDLTGGMVFSRDGKQLAFESSTGPSRIAAIRVATLEGSGVPPSRPLLAVDDATTLFPSDWSPDGQWLAVIVKRKNLTGEVALVSARDGTMRTLKSTDWRGAVRIFFSPDSQYIAYTQLSSERSDESDVFVMAIDASREEVAVAGPSHNMIMGWTLDGKQLLFASNRAGSLGLWAQTIASGKPQGAPVLLRADLGDSPWSFGLTSAGTLHVLKMNNTNSLEAAPLDLTAGRRVPLEHPIFKRFVGTGGLPAWSPDGRSLAYRISPPGDSSHVLAIASIETGQARELRPPLSYLSSFTWSMDGRALTLTGTDLKGRRGIYRLDVHTGAFSTEVVQVPGEYGLYSIDHKKIYYRLAGSILERDVESGRDRTLFQSRATGNSASIIVSPDGRYIGCVEGSRTSSTLLLIPAAGGEPREILRVAAPEQLDGFRMVWTPDSQNLIVPRFQRGDSDAQPSRQALWLAPVTGEPARRLEIDVNNWLIGPGHFDVSRDGRHIAYVALSGKSFAEVWALENVLPAREGKR